MAFQNNCILDYSFLFKKRKKQPLKLKTIHKFQEECHILAPNFLRISLGSALPVNYISLHF